MKSNGHSSALLVPDARGWRLSVAGSEDRSVPTLEEALGTVPANARIELALPCQSVLLERHKLPAIDRAELADMLQLQLEKTLPFPVEEVSHGFEVLGQEENESTILAIAAHHSQLAQICAPLRNSGRLPERITLNALRQAAACPADETVLAVWPEQEQLVIAIVAGGKLAWAHTIASLDPEGVLAELPGALVTAEVECASTAFSSVRLSPACSQLEAVVAGYFKKPVLPLGEGVAGTTLDLLPAAWNEEAGRRQRGERLKQNLLFAAVGYLLIIAGAFVYLAWLKTKKDSARREVLNLEKKFEPIKRQEDRWKTLSAAVEPARFGVEVLFQLHKCRAGDEKVRFTSFNFGPNRWDLKGEADSADVWFTFTQAIKEANKPGKALEAFTVEAPPYTPIAGKDAVSFGVTGKPN
jgi:hypothetical protein